MHSHQASENLVRSIMQSIEASYADSADYEETPPFWKFQAERLIQALNVKYSVQDRDKTRAVFVRYEDKENVYYTMGNEPATSYCLQGLCELHCRPRMEFFRMYGGGNDRQENVRTSRRNHDTMTVDIAA